METKDLIDKLAKDVKPVKRLPDATVRFGRWLFAGLLCVGAGLAIFGVRPDLADCLFRADFILRTTGLAVVTALSAAGAFALSVPGQDRGARTWLLPVAALAAWGVLLVALFITGEWQPLMKLGFGCVREIIFLGLGPGLLLFWMIRKASPFKLDMSGFLIVLSAAALGALGRQFSCAIDNPMYIFTWHFLPVAILGALGALVGRLVLGKS